MTVPRRVGWRAGWLVIAVSISLAGVARAGHDLDDLNRLRANPLTGLRSVSLSDTLSFGYLSDDGVQNLVGVQLLWPFRLTRSLDVISYTLTGAASQPSADPGGGTIVGLSDTVVNLVVSPTRTGVLFWGLGPVVQLPTATDPQLGIVRAGRRGRLAAGPAVALFVQPLPWTAGFLANNLWSFDGSGPDSVNGFSLQYFLSSTLPQGWFVESNATVTAAWNAPDADRWTVPLSVGGGKVFQFAGQSLGVSGEALCNVRAPTIGPDWGLSFTVQFLFP